MSGRENYMMNHLVFYRQKGSDPYAKMGQQTGKAG